jgi:hypothetical protein
LKTMDCDHCNDLLLDYLYDELDEVRSASMRKHIEGCASCRQASEILSRGRTAARSLALVEAPLPSAALLEAIQSAAIANERPRSAAGLGAVASVIPLESHSRVPRWLRRAGELAMRRQVAMAAVFLLMIGFGLSYQLQSPTHPLPTSDDPSAQVIPAHELPIPAQATNPLLPQPRNARLGNNRGFERLPEHRGQANAAPRAARVEQVAVAPPTETLRPEGNGGDNRLTATSVDDSANMPTTTAPAPATNHGNVWEAPSNPASGAPSAAYRNVPAPAQAPGSVVNAPVGVDNGYGRGMPSFPRGEQGNTANGLAGAQNQQPAPTSWNGLRDTGNTHRARGENELAATAFRSALALDPPASERDTIARALYDTLIQGGHVREATEVRARYLTRASDTNSLANEATPVQAAQSSSNSVPSVSRPAPSRPVNRARRAAPSNFDAIQQNAY